MGTSLFSKISSRRTSSPPRTNLCTLLDPESQTPCRLPALRLPRFTINGPYRLRLEDPFDPASVSLARACSGSRSSPTSFHPFDSRRKYVRTGFCHAGYSLLFAVMSTAMKLSTVVGNPAGASIVVVALLVSDRRRVAPVALSNPNQDAR